MQEEPPEATVRYKLLLHAVQTVDEVQAVQPDMKLEQVPQPDGPLTYPVVQTQDPEDTT